MILEDNLDVVKKWINSVGEDLFYLIKYIYTGCINISEFLKYVPCYTSNNTIHF